MRINYFSDTDTLLLTFSENKITDTHDLNENILVEMDKNGQLVSMTIEHAKQQTNVSEFSYQQVAG